MKKVNAEVIRVVLISSLVVAHLVVLSACGKMGDSAEAQAGASVASTSVSDLNDSVLKAESALQTLTPDKPESAANKTDEQILADEKKHLEGILAKLGDKVAALQAAGTPVPQGLQDATDRAIALVEKALDRLANDKAFQQQVIAAARKIASGDFKPDLEKQCKMLSKILGGDTSKLKPEILKHLQEQFDKNCK